MRTLTFTLCLLVSIIANAKPAKQTDCQKYGGKYCEEKQYNADFNRKLKQGELKPNQSLAMYRIQNSDGGTLPSTSQFSAYLLFVGFFGLLGLIAFTTRVLYVAFLFRSGSRAFYSFREWLKKKRNRKKRVNPQGFGFIR